MEGKIPKNGPSICVVSSHSNVDCLCVCWYRQKLDKVSSSMFVIAAMSSDNSSIVCIMPGGCTQVLPLSTLSYQYLNVLNQPCLKRKFIHTTSFIKFKTVFRIIKDSKRNIDGYSTTLNMT